MLLTPLHTRMLTLRLSWGGGGLLVAEGRILDLRKRGVVPLLGKLQGPGVVHDMAVRLLLDVEDLRIREIHPVMSAFPFAPSSATRGEGCPDRLPDVQRLLGCSLREGFGAQLGEQIGGPRGCFHIFTMLRLIGPAIEQVCERQQRRRIAAAPAAMGSPLFARSLIIDGLKGEGLSLMLRGMLFDVHYRPGAEELPIEEELEASFEATADVEVSIPTMAIAACNARLRQSGPQIDTPGDWQTEATAAQLVGNAMLKGFSARVQAVYAPTSGLEPLQHLLFMMAPAMIQCLPSLVEEIEQRPRRAEGPHAAVDSCHMWRADGPLVKGPIWGT
jgi:hypothetical protein